ncbi:hypothetical protein DW741_04930 [Ruminococcaceae bacterium AM28-23LB]|nr:hypothetical protein DW741_04930 [Ruminococcaceae bacterium AM28-23LB]
MGSAGDGCGLLKGEVPVLEGILLAVIALLALLLWLRAGKRNKQSPEGPEQEQEREEGPLLDVLALRGFSYIPGGEHLALWEGEELIFKREPDNPFDPKAVAVLRENGQRIGYLPREYNAIPAALLEEGILLTGRLRLGNYGKKEVEVHWPRN